MNVRRNAVAHLTALSHSRVLGQLASRLDAPRMTTRHSSYASAYPCTIDFERFRAIADETGAIAHISWSTGASWRAHRRSKQWHQSEFFNGVTSHQRVQVRDTAGWSPPGCSRLRIFARVHHGSRNRLCGELRRFRALGLQGLRLQCHPQWSFVCVASPWLRLQSSRFSHELERQRQRQSTIRSPVCAGETAGAE